MLELAADERDPSDQRVRVDLAARSSTACWFSPLKNTVSRAECQVARLEQSWSTPSAPMLAWTKSGALRRDDLSERDDRVLLAADVRRILGRPDDHEIVRSPRLRIDREPVGDEVHHRIARVDGDEIDAALAERVDDHRLGAGRDDARACYR